MMEGANGRKDSRFDLGVEDVFHVGPARVRQDGAIAKRAQPTPLSQKIPKKHVSR